jgi:hypothetical protein
MAAAARKIAPSSAPAARGPRGRSAMVRERACSISAPRVSRATSAPSASAPTTCAVTSPATGPCQACGVTGACEPLPAGTVDPACAPRRLRRGEHLRDRPHRRRVLDLVDLRYRRVDRRRRRGEPRHHRRQLRRHRDLRWHDVHRDQLRRVGGPLQRGRPRLLGGALRRPRERGHHGDRPRGRHALRVGLAQRGRHDRRQRPSR